MTTLTSTYTQGMEALAYFFSVLFGEVAQSTEHLIKTFLIVPAQHRGRVVREVHQACYVL